MKITVTKQHIRRAVPRDVDNCPVALACQEAGMEGAKVGAGRGKASLSLPIGPKLGNGLLRTRRLFVLPVEVGLFSFLFDLECVLDPFSFPLPEEVVRFLTSKDSCQP